MKKILVIGSEGFIGKHVVRFLKKYFTILRCDISNITDSDYLRANIKREDFKHIFEDDRIKDLYACINCSGAANVSDSIVNPISDYYANTVNVFYILEAIRKITPTTKYINLSSAAVYGNPEKLPINEIDKINPVSPYGFHKFMAENICKEYNLIWKIPTISLRIFSAYGEGLKKQILWDIYRKTRDKKRICLFGTGKESRDFIHVQDICQSIWLVLQNAKFNGNSINIANGLEIYIEELVRLYCKIDNFAGDVMFSGENRKGDPINWRADISELKKLGYKQSVDIEDGVKRYFMWINNEES